MQRDACYACRKQGHWAKDCPDKPMAKSMPASTTLTPISNQSIPDKQCPHCGGTCVVKTSNTKMNPERKFYKCPENLGSNDNFFQWCDKESSDQKRNIRFAPKPNLMSSDSTKNAPQFPYPECSCGAGVCKLETADTEGNKGRKYFVCPVKKGQGACNFYQWQDTPGNAMNGGHIDGNVTLDSQEETSKDANNGTNDLSSSVPEDRRLGKLSYWDHNVSEEKTGTCSRCSKEGHLASDCLKPSSSPFCEKLDNGYDDYNV